MKNMSFGLFAAIALTTGFAFAEPSAKAVWDSVSTTLAFYYDETDHAGEGTVYSIGTGSQPTWYADVKGTLTKVVFDESFKGFRPTTCSYWFGDCVNLGAIEGIENLDTSEVTSMYCMFYKAGQSNAALTTIDLTHFNTAKVTNMAYMFQYASHLTSLDFTSFDTAKVTTFGRFLEYSGLTGELDLSSFDTSSLTDTTEMFWGIGISMIYVSDTFTVEKVTRSDYMFGSNPRLKGEKGSMATGKNYDKTYAHVDEGLSNPGFFTLKRDAPVVIPAGKAIWDATTTTLTFVFDNQTYEGDGITVYEVEGGNKPSWYDGVKDSLTRVVFKESFKVFRPTTCSYWFGDCVNLGAIEGIENLDTSEVTTMYCMFFKAGQSNTALTTIDLTHFNTAKVTNMAYMFQYASHLTSLDFSSFDTSKVTNFGYFLAYTPITGELDLTSFDTSSATTMGMMFYGMTKVEKIYVGRKFTVENVTEANSSYMFGKNTNLTGRKGSRASGDNYNKNYAHEDGGVGNEGFLTVWLNGMTIIFL